MMIRIAKLFLLSGVAFFYTLVVLTTSPITTQMRNMSVMSC